MNANSRLLTRLRAFICTCDSKQLILLVLLVSLCGCSSVGQSPRESVLAKEPSVSTPADLDFKARCSAPGVVRCFGFDSPNSIQEYIHDPAADGVQRLLFDPNTKASGKGSMRADMPGDDPGGANVSGNFAIPFTDDDSFQVGQGQEVFIQWRQRFDKEMLTEKPDPGNGWKQFILSEGRRPGNRDPGSCTEMHLVVENTYYRNFPIMYHSCSTYEDLMFRSPVYGDWMLQNATPKGPCVRKSEKFPPCVGYKPDQWMTFQLHVKVGTWFNGGEKKHDSWIQLWVAEEGQPSQLVIDINPKKGYGGVEAAGWDLRNSNPLAKYGRVWLLPYTTNRTPESRCDGKPCKDTHTWYDELIISKQRIPDPAK